MRTQTRQVPLILLLWSAGIIKGLSSNNYAAKVDTPLSRCSRVAARCECWKIQVRGVHECVCVKDKQLYSFPNVTQPQSPLLGATGTNTGTGERPTLKASTPPGGHLSLSGWPPAGAEMWLWVSADAAQLWRLCQRPLSEHAMTEITVMRLGGQGGLVMLVSTCCTDAHKC